MFYSWSATHTSNHHIGHTRFDGSPYVYVLDTLNIGVQSSAYPDIPSSGDDMDE